MTFKHVIGVAVLIVLTAALALAEVPGTISYQGYLKNANGTPVTAATEIRFSLYSSNPARNNPVWRETQNVTPANGVYSVRLGSVTPVAVHFDAPYYLGVKVGADAEMPLQPLSSTPYAMRAAVAESANSIGGQSLPSRQPLHRSDPAGACSGTARHSPLGPDQGRQRHLCGWRRSWSPCF